MWETAGANTNQHQLGKKEGQFFKSQATPFPVWKLLSTRQAPNSAMVTARCQSGVSNWEVAWWIRWWSHFIIIRTKGIQIKFRSVKGVGILHCKMSTDIQLSCIHSPNYMLSCKQWLSDATLTHLFSLLQAGMEFSYPLHAWVLVVCSEHPHQLLPHSPFHCHVLKLLPNKSV